MYFLDADVCIEFMRGRCPEGLRVLQQSDPALFKVPSIVVGELMTGVEKSRNPKANRLMTECFLAPFDVIDFDYECALKYAQVRASLEKQGCKIGPKDTMIAAMALTHSAVLVTNNLGEFARVNGLQLETWSVVDL